MTCLPGPHLLFNPNNVADCSFNRLVLKLFSLSSKVFQTELKEPRTQSPVISVLPEALLCSVLLVMDSTDKPPQVYL